MTPKEMLRIAGDLGLGPKEFAHLAGISVRTIRRGVRNGSTVDVLLKGIQERLQDPRTHLSIRALSIISARGEGLKAFVTRLIHAYAALDRP